MNDILYQILLTHDSNSKFKVSSKNADFDCWYIGTHTKEKPSKISNIEVAILLIKILYLNN